MSGQKKRLLATTPNEPYELADIKTRHRRLFGVVKKARKAMDMDTDFNLSFVFRWVGSGLSIGDFLELELEDAHNKRHLIP